jgi:hypothetical protein
MGDFLLSKFDFKFNLYRYTPVTMTPASPQVTAAVTTAATPPPRRVVVRWVDAATGEAIAGGDAEVYAAPAPAPAADAAAAAAADDTAGDDTAGDDADEDEKNALKTTTKQPSPEDGGGVSGGGVGALITSAAKDAAAGGVVIDGSPYEIKRPFDDMPARIVVRVTGPDLSSASSSSTGGGEGGEGGEGEVASSSPGGGGFYTEVTEELHFTSEADHTKWVTAHLLRMPAGEEHRVWVVISAGGSGDGSGGGSAKLLKDVRLWCPTGEEVSCAAPSARYAEAEMLSPASAAAAAAAAADDDDAADATPLAPAAAWALRAPLTGGKAADAWYRLLVDCSGGGGGVEDGDAVEASGAVARVYRGGADGREASKPAHVVKASQCIGGGGWWDVAVWADELPPGGLFVPINEAREALPAERMTSVRDRVKAYKDAAEAKAAA